MRSKTNNSKNVVALAFSKPLDFGDPFLPLGKKRPVYEELLRLLANRNWQSFVVSTKTYQGGGVFRGGWKLSPDGKLEAVSGQIKVDLVYDRSGGLTFPLAKDSLRVVDSRKFKELAWNKWEAYQKFGKYMPKTFWVGGKKNLPKALAKIKGDFVVLKPADGLKGKGIIIGPKSQALDFEFLPERPNYIAQEFVDTSLGIGDLTKGYHDLRVVVVNKKIVWAHIRTPLRGSYKANVASGGHLKEISVKRVPKKVKLITQKIANTLYSRYDNPVYSLDFGVGRDSKPYVFEINDQIGFPKPKMQAKDAFLKELIKNFASKIKK